MKPLRKLVMLRGFPASGKTTYARQLIEEKPNNYLRICPEDLRNMMFFGDKENCKPGGVSYWQGKNRRFCCKVIRAIARIAFENGYDVIADSSHLERRCETFYRGVTRCRAKMSIITMTTPFDECLRRNRLRDNPIPDYNLVTLHDDLRRRTNKQI